jgi:hypothetical protein
MGTGKKLIKNAYERYETLKMHKVHKNRVKFESGEIDNDDVRTYTEGKRINTGHRTFTAMLCDLIM